MAFSLLSGMKIVEISAFIAAPLAGLTLAQLGAEVIRIDPVGGGIDAHRWPISETGTSLYWSGLNREKASICLDLKSREGLAVLHRLLAGHSADDGILLTNLTGPEPLGFEALCEYRNDLVMVDLKGHHDGSGAVDYTVNAAVGVPFMTGPEAAVGPINHQLPAWDAAAGLSLSTAILAAVHKRRATGQAQHISVALSDVALAFLGNTGVMPEAELTGRDRPRLGNHVYGAFGHDLPTLDGRYVMLVAITPRQWSALLEATDLVAEMAAVENRLGLDFTTDNGRYAGRNDIVECLENWSRRRTFADVMEVFERYRLLYGPYRTTTQMLAEDPRASLANPMMQQVDHDGVGTYRLAGSPIRPAGSSEGPLCPPGQIGADTRRVLARAGFSQDDIDDLTHRGIAGGPV